MSAFNFDPYAALAEIENGAGLRDNWANRAEVSPKKADPSETLAPLALSPVENAKMVGGAMPPAGADWKQALARLAPDTPPDAFTLTRWRELVEDARWLADQHGASAYALSWTVPRQHQWHRFEVVI